LIKDLLRIRTFPLFASQCQQLLKELICIKEASRDIGKALAIKAEHHIVVVKSTVVPEVND